MSQTPVNAERPSNYTAVCIAAIVIGALLFFGSCTGAISLAIGVERSSHAFSPAHTAAPFGDIQARMNKALTEHQEKWKPFTIAQLSKGVLLAGALIVVGIRALKMNRRTKRTLERTLAAAFVIESCFAIPQLLNLYQVSAITDRFMSELMQAMPIPGGDFFGSIMSSLQSTGMVFGAALMAGQIVFYALAVRYLRTVDTAD
jgi:hypothetical protein